MDFSFTEEQEMLRAQVRSFLESEFTPERVAELAESKEGWDEATWTTMAELGWTGLSVAGELGGAAMSFLEEAVLFEELGYGLYPGPYFASIAMALPALQGAPELLRSLAEGGARATLACAEPDGARSIEDTDRLTTSAEPNGERWTVTGIKEPVADLALVSHVVVSATTDAGAGLWLVEPQPPAVTPLETVDSTRRMGRLGLEAHPAKLLVEPGNAGAVLGHIRARVDAALALEAVGVAQRVLELARDYASERKQFGKAIGSYQAVSHQLADTYMSIELARSLAYWAAWSVAESEGTADRAAAAARALASEAAVAACERSIQVHGGIGFTWEHVLHRYYKRALGIAVFNGTPAKRRAAVAASLLGG
ncbi:MAG: acyl-CoA dehydrogenase family protein [Actinomycetota bacterium]